MATLEPGFVRTAALTTGILAAVASYLVWNDLRDNGAASPDEIAALRGAAIYAQNCAVCHGSSLEGEPDWQTPRADGSYPAPPHDETGHTWHHPDELLFDYTKKGGQEIAGPGFQSNMPAFADRLNDAEISAVLAFIKSTWPEPIRKRQARLNRLNSQNQ